MKIILINAVGIRGQGGATVVEELTRAMATARPDTSFVLVLYRPEFRDFIDPTFPANVTIHHAPIRDGLSSRFYWYYVGLPQLSRKFGCDCCIDLANMFSSMMPCPGIALIHNNILFTENRSAPIEGAFRNVIRKYFARKTIRIASYTVVQTESLKKAIIQRVGECYDRKVIVIPSGVRSQSAETLPSDHIKQVMSEGEGADCVFISFPHPHKNIERLVSAFAIVASRHKEARLLLTVRPDDALVNPQVRKVLGIVKEKNLEKRFVLLGTLSYADVNYTLKNSQLMVFPSLLESFGLGQVEAMAAGCPVAAADLGYAHDVCGDAAVYFDPYSVESIADTMLSVLNQPALAAELREKGLKRAENYRYDKIAERFRELVDKIIEKKNS